MPLSSSVSSSLHSFSRSCILVMLMVLLQACGVPGPGGGSSRDQSSDALIPEVRFLIRLNTAGLTFSNNLSRSRISVVQLNEDFTERPSLPASVPAYDVIENSTGEYEIQFGNTFPSNLNVVISARFNDDNVLYAPLYMLANQSESIEISVRSHYVMKKLFDTVDAATLNELISCDTTGNYGCDNQADAKMRLLRNISELAGFYELDLAQSSTVAAALTAIDNSDDIRTHVETAVADITRVQSPVAKGTRRDTGGTLPGELNDRLTYAENYNSVLFGLGINQVLRSDNNAAVVSDRVSLSTLSSDFVDETILTDEQKFSDNVNLLDIRTDALSSNIIHRRSTLTFDGIDIVRDITEPNVDFGFTSSDSHLSTEGYLLASRRLLQTISDADDGDDPRDIGWQLNPVYSQLYRANDYEPDTSLDLGIDEEDPVFDASPTWLLGSNYSSGATYFDNNILDSQFTRGNKREDMDLFTWEIHGRKTDSDFSAGDINGKTYGVVSYSLKLSETGETLQLFAETMRWDAVAGVFDITQPSAEFRSYVLSRASNNAVTYTPDQTGIVADDYSFTLRETPDIEGFVQLDSGSRAPMGHGTQDGRHLAFAMNTLERGRGIMIATELDTSGSPNFTGENYKIQGNVMSMTNTENTLRNVNGSQLSITSDLNTANCSANLSLTFLNRSHDVDNNSVSGSQSDLGATLPSTSCTQSTNAIEMTFNNVNGTTLTLKGFVSQPADGEDAGRVLSLLWIQNNSLGLVYAMQTQNLATVFEE